MVRSAGGLRHRAPSVLQGAERTGPCQPGLSNGRGPTKTVVGVTRGGLTGIFPFPEWRIKTEGSYDSVVMVASHRECGEPVGRASWGPQSGSGHPEGLRRLTVANDGH